MKINLCSICSRNSSRVVALFLRILNEDEHFFEKQGLPVSRLSIKVGDGYLVPASNLINIAKVFLHVKNNNIEDLKKLKPVVEISTLKHTFIAGEPMAKIPARDNPIQKSVLLIALENLNYEIAELLMTWGLDVNDLGETCINDRRNTSSSIRNQFNLWYILIKHLLTATSWAQIDGQTCHSAVIIKKLSKFEKFREGPAIVGSMFEAMRVQDPDMEFLKGVRKYFPDWFNAKFKMMDMQCTAHELLVKYKCFEGANLLQSHLGPNRENQMSDHSFRDKINALVSLEAFGKFISENKDILSQRFTGGTPFIQRLSDCSSCTEEKLKVAIKEGADPNEENSVGENLVDFVLKQADFRLESAKTLLSLMTMQDECEEIGTLISRSPHLVLNFCTQIFKARDQDIKDTLILSFESLINSPVFSLETLLFPQRVSQTEKAVAGAFKSIRGNHQLLNLVTKACVKLILTQSQKNSAEVDESKISNFLLVLKALCADEINNNIETVFKDMKELIDAADPDYPLSSWRDKYDMTLLMRMVLFSEENFGHWIDPLICYIIRARLFDDGYLGYQVKNGLAIRFQTSHIHDMVKDSKRENDVIEKDQIYKGYRIKKVNPDTQKLEEIKGTRQLDGQFKMMVMANVRNENGDFVQKPTIITAENTNISKEVILEENEEDDTIEQNEGGLAEDRADEQEDSLSDFDFVERESIGSVDVSDFSGEEEQDEDIEQSEEFEKIERDGKEEIHFVESEQENSSTEEENKTQYVKGYVKEVLTSKGKIVTPVHFNTAKVKTSANAKSTISQQTYMTEKGGKYKVAPSASTRFIETVDAGEGPSRHYSNHITLTLLVCKTKKWDILSTILNKSPKSYPRTLQSTTEKKGKHPLLMTDGLGHKCLDFILESEQFLLIERMFDLIDADKLKSQSDSILTKIKDLCKSTDDDYVGILFMVMHKIGKKYDKSNLGNLLCSHVVLDVTGKSCGFEFKPYKGLTDWKCSQCNVTVKTNDELELENNNHYISHECKFEFPCILNPSGHLLLEKLKFKNYGGDEDDEEEGDVKDDWRCIKKNCKAMINVVGDKFTVEPSQEFQHSCKPNTMEVVATLDDFKFNLKPKAEDEADLKWQCQNCPLEIKTTADFRLTMFYRKSMHECLSKVSV